ncbi:MAG: hypothetical protein JJLCMIEE_00838 [Acidimicrobiales bacterium]|nr:MAG: sugar transferase [Actinomycetota bacterium]MBV6507780.1 hypothetical protein [Acidimicrobiales bacterium]RIK05938.1 MAG: polyprenyl glycosylphosphotransferase [Acidobacteriota bacterium]
MTIEDTRTLDLGVVFSEDFSWDPVAVDRRRGAAAGLRLLGAALDLAALAVASLLIAGTDAAVGWTFAVAGILLLYPTSRKGRLLPRVSETFFEVLARIGVAALVAAVVLIWTPEQGEALLEAALYAVPLVLLGRVVMFAAVRTARRAGVDVEDTLIIGAGPTGVGVATALCEHPEAGLAPIGFVDRFDDSDLPLPIVARPEHLEPALRELKVRHVVLAFGAASEEEVVQIVRRCNVHPVQYYSVPRFFELGVVNRDLADIDGFPLEPISQPGVVGGGWWLKRAFDVVVASTILVLALPVLGVTAVLVKLSSPGPVLFRQKRVGMNGELFEMLKFRTMVVNDDDSEWSVGNDDERITRVGRVLRPTHLDELPQLINVLRGDMSIVGPRPERPHHADRLTAEVDGYEHRHRVPVGITGLAQVHGYFGNTCIHSRVRLDNRYIENWSIWRDLMIGIRTLPSVFHRRR